MITVAGIALALVTVAFAAVPTPCTFPDTWSGVIAAEINGRDGVRQDLFDVAYDAANERVAAAASIGLEKYPYQPAPPLHCVVYLKLSYYAGTSAPLLCSRRKSSMYSTPKRSTAWYKLLFRIVGCVRNYRRAAGF